uniref:Phosphatidylinositol-3-phosphatase SAC1 n=1 Tax=Steinernema glaseri TaxID=37863 RepID=A0A1I7Z0B5_9BILA
MATQKSITPLPKGAPRKSSAAVTPPPTRVRDRGGAKTKDQEYLRYPSGSVSSFASVGKTLSTASKTSTVDSRRRRERPRKKGAEKLGVVRLTMKSVDQPMASSDVYEKLNLYVLADKFYLEPRDRNGELCSDSYLEIDRVSDELRVINASQSPIPIVHAEIRPIYGVVGIIKLIAGHGLIIIKRAELVGQVNGHDIWSILETEVIPYKKGTMHLTEKQIRFNRHFMDMIQSVLSTKGFYYSATFDITRSFQWLNENATPDFRNLSLMERADERFVWNRYLSTQFIADGRLGKYTLPIMHGFIGIRRASVNGATFQLAIISRRSVHRAGVRFFMRGVNSDGHSANYVETEQIVQYDRGSPDNRMLTSFVQIRGSIPLYWSQHPNLRWQPTSTT